MIKNEFEIAVALAKKGAADAVEPLTTGMTYKGAVDYYGDLPASPTVGDLYLVRYQGSSGDRSTARTPGPMSRAAFILTENTSYFRRKKPWQRLKDSRID